MKPRLIKFTCPACNARLAVPDAMAGMEDNCPKCAARIRAPLPAPEPAPVADPEPASAAEATPGKSRHSILNAVLHAPEPATTMTTRPAKSQEKAGAPKAREASRSALFDEFLSAAPQPPAIEAAAKAPSAKPPKLRRKPPDAAKPMGAPEPEPPPPAQPATPPVPESTPAAAATPTLLEIISTPEPNPLAPPPEPEEELEPSPSTSEPTETDDPDIGMGEMIAEQSSSPSPSVARHVIPSLGVGLMQVEDRPRQQELRRRRRAVVTGIILFLLLDAVVLCWIFRRPILEWWNDRRPVAVAQRTVPPPSRDSGTPAPPLKPAATPAATATGKDPSRPLASAPAIEPGKPVPPLIPEAPFPAPIADAAAPGDLPAPPLLDANLGAQPAPSPREVGDIPGKREFSAAQIGPPLVPSSTASDSPDAPLMTPATKELLTTLDVPLLVTPTPAETTAAVAKDDLKAKMETTPPPSPPSPPPAATIPEAAGQPPTPEPAPGLTATAEIDVPPAPAKIVETGIIPAARPALAALKNFLAAPTWQERLRWVQKPETVKAAMEKHYRMHSDGPVNVARIDFIERYPARSGNPPYCMFEVSGGDLKRTLLVLVEEKSKADFRVDWEAFAEFKDQLLREFLSKAGSPPGKFRVMIRRSHSFDKSVPDLDRKDSFELSQPGIDTTGKAYAVKGATVARALSQQLGWGESIAVTVQLAWRSEGDRSWVEVAAVPAFGWRG